MKEIVYNLYPSELLNQSKKVTGKKLNLKPKMFIG